MDSVDMEGRTPLLVAVENLHEPIVALLLQAGACVGVTDRGGNMPLGIAIARGHAAIARMLRTASLGVGLVAAAPERALAVLSLLFALFTSGLVTPAGAAGRAVAIVGIGTLARSKALPCLFRVTFPACLFLMYAGDHSECDELRAAAAVAWGLAMLCLVRSTYTCPVAP